MRQNRKPDVDFNQDLVVMEKLIESNPAQPTISDMFGFFPDSIREFLKEGVDLDCYDDLTVKGNKFAYKKTNGDMSKQLVLLLVYMMVSNVLDDSGMETQM